MNLNVYSLELLYAIISYKLIAVIKLSEFVISKY